MKTMFVMYEAGAYVREGERLFQIYTPYSARSVKVTFFRRILEIRIYVEDSRELI
jgi:hypothetical protein